MKKRPNEDSSNKKCGSYTKLNELNEVDIEKIKCENIRGINQDSTNSRNADILITSMRKKIDNNGILDSSIFSDSAWSICKYHGSYQYLDSTDDYMHICENIENRACENIITPYLIPYKIFKVGDDHTPFKKKNVPYNTSREGNNYISPGNIFTESNFNISSSSKARKKFLEMKVAHDKNKNNTSRCKKKSRISNIGKNKGSTNIISVEDNIFDGENINGVKDKEKKKRFDLKNLRRMFKRGVNIFNKKSEWI